MMLEYERVMIKLLKGQPKAKPFGRLVNGKFMTGTLSLHRTKQSLAWQRFIRIHKRVGKTVDQK